MLALLRTVVHCGCIAPALWLAWVLNSGDETALGSDPVKEIEHFLGYTAIIIFCVMFALGIVLQRLNKNQYQILRRPLGIWAFVWALTHMASYLFLELGLDFSLFFKELTQRGYLILGAIALLILGVMTVTSLPSIKRALGKRWFSVHQFAYPALIAAAVHYYWSVKSLTLAPIVIAIIVAVIVGFKFVGAKKAA